MNTFYYIFEVNDSLGQKYYILNNQYIGYVGFDSQEFLAFLEYNAKVKKKYKLFAKSLHTSNKELHELNCNSTRFSLEEINNLMDKYPIFSLSNDNTEYQVYFPNKNSSKSYLKEIDGFKTIH